MDTPICDFVRRYAQSGALRCHMPGHKGQALLGMEGLDITEIAGADSLYEADGIIARSEENAGSLFGAKTFYSAEGSSLCIRAMLHLAALHARQAGKAPLIAAARNVHKVFLSAAALLGLETQWLCPGEQESYLSCRIEPEELEALLRQKPVTAVYVTSPDYLGGMQDIGSLAKVCHRYGCLLLVDNAHGAYLKFLPRSLHPMDLGADLCCDSAHKTLPALTGAAYLHISPAVSPQLAQQAKNAMALFGSTSPSYLILQSLDAVNAYLADGYADALAAFAQKTEQLKGSLALHGYSLRGQEPLKLTVAAKPYGYTGTALAALLEARGIVYEFCDPDHLVLMLTPQLGEEGLERLETALKTIPARPPIEEKPPVFRRCAQVLSVREAVLSPCETVPASRAVGRVLAAPSVGCPPAVPILVCGERIDEATVDAFAYYGIKTCSVVK